MSLKRVSDWEDDLAHAMTRVQDAAYHPGEDFFIAFYDFQEEYQNALGNAALSDEEGIRRNVLYAIVELVEALNEVPWKWHRPVDLINEDRLAEELADVMCFVLNIAWHAGIDIVTLEQACAQVVAKNYARLKKGVNR